MDTRYDMTSQTLTHVSANPFNDAYTQQQEQQQFYRACMQYQRTKSRLLYDTYSMITYLSFMFRLCIKHSSSSFNSTGTNKGIMNRRQQFHHNYQAQQQQQLSPSYETMEHSWTQINPLPPSLYHEYDNTMDDDMSSENDDL